MSAIPVASSPMAASTSSHYRHPSHSAVPRSPSPPASAYFPLLSANENTTRFRPTPDAEAHFAYSTQLRRHQSESAAALSSPAVFAAAVNAEATSLWTRVVNTMTGRKTNEYQAVENGRASPLSAQAAKDTASGRWAHESIEVSAHISYPSIPSSDISFLGYH